MTLPIPQHDLPEEAPAGLRRVRGHRDHDRDPPTADELLAVGIEVLKQIPDAASGLEHAVTVTEYVIDDGYYLKLDGPKTGWRIDISTLPKNLQHEFSAAWAKAAAKQFRGASMFLSFVIDVPTISMDTTPLAPGASCGRSDRQPLESAARWPLAQAQRS